ncbi:hypothetical protein EV294_102673 [Paenibacillus sp. BK033]|uniref:hypothetical protein n=1 Tax=Paenibacillus sp. BK033 TaxID=2512133 RepID=UPI001046440F|nr:hypothetical protein [Paenibacillus sp. BK033]TCM99377.1 hypothetical protein EV294_102673 [Paenibacillus sp. BK033]
MSSSDWLTAINIFMSTVLTIIIIVLTSKGSRINEQNAAAARDSAESAKLTYELSKQMFERQIKKEQRSWEALRRRYLRIVLNNARSCHFGLLQAYSVRIDGTSNSIVEIRKAPRGHGLTNEQLAEYFDDTEIETIDKAWLVFNDFITKYFKDPYNGDDELAAISNAGGTIEEFHKLISFIEKELT